MLAATWPWVCRTVRLFVLIPTMANRFVSPDLICGLSQKVHSQAKTVPGSFMAGDELLGWRMKLFLNTAYAFYMTCASYPSFFFLKGAEGEPRIWTPGIADLLKVNQSGLPARPPAPLPTRSPSEYFCPWFRRKKNPPRLQETPQLKRGERTGIATQSNCTKAGVVGETLVCLYSKSSAAV